MKLNDWHEKIRLRNAEVFANNKHTRETAALAVISEIGEMCNAIVGVMGCEERKKHLTNADILDGVGDACVYLSILADKCGVSDLEELVSVEKIDRSSNVPRDAVALAGTVAVYATAVGTGSLPTSTLGTAFRALKGLAEVYGCTDFFKLLADTYNHVSERSGSVYRVEP